MDDRLIVAQQQVSDATHHTLCLMMFAFIIICFLVVLPSYESSYLPTVIKLGVVVVLAIVLVASYGALDSTVRLLEGAGEEANTIKEQVFYNYILNFALFVFAAFLIYSCL